MSEARNIKILGVGQYLPGHKVSAGDVDQRAGCPDGWTLAKTGVAVRYYVYDETSSQMGMRAAQEALEDAGLVLKDIDCIICASAIAEQEVPCTAALVQKELGGECTGIPAFDVNASCLSFVTALDIISYMIEAGRYDKILIVSTEIASVGLNWADRESCSIFGDGAAAVVVGRTPKPERSRILGSAMETYSKGASCSEIRSGGAKMHAQLYTEAQRADFCFRMEGKRLYKLAVEIMPGFIDKLIKSIHLQISDISMVIPHQASLPAMVLLQKKLGVAKDRFMYNVQEHGNTVAASIPMALYEAVRKDRIQRGDLVMLMGVSAGISVGALILEY